MHSFSTSLWYATPPFWTMHLAMLLSSIIISWTLRSLLRTQLGNWHLTAIVFCSQILPSSTIISISLACRVQHPYIRGPEPLLWCHLPPFLPSTHFQIHILNFVVLFSNHKALFLSLLLPVLLPSFQLNLVFHLIPPPSSGSLPGFPFVRFLMNFPSVLELAQNLCFHLATALLWAPDFSLPLGRLLIFSSPYLLSDWTIIVTAGIPGLGVAESKHISRLNPLKFCFLILLDISTNSCSFYSDISVTLTIHSFYLLFKPLSTFPVPHSQWLSWLPASLRE